MRSSVWYIPLMMICTRCNRFSMYVIQRSKLIDGGNSLKPMKYSMNYRHSKIAVPRIWFKIGQILEIHNCKVYTFTDYSSMMLHAWQVESMPYVLLSFWMLILRSNVSRWLTKSMTLLQGLSPRITKIATDIWYGLRIFPKIGLRNLSKIGILRYFISFVATSIHGGRSARYIKIRRSVGYLLLTYPLQWPWMKISNEWPKLCSKGMMSVYVALRLSSTNHALILSSEKSPRST